MAAVKDSPPPAAAASPTGSTPEFVEQFPPQKRKGGRKPVYATQEERKQRNRAAQAAFRERRTEYMKKLETTIKENEETLSNLSNTARLAQETVLMLRYKNSLLERILLEKGIDVKAELEAFGNTYDTPVTSAPTSMGQPLSISGHTAPILGQPLFKAPDNNPFKVSPSLASASLSHSSSPTASSAVPTPPDNSSMGFSPRPNILSNEYSSPHPGSFMTSGFPSAFRGNSLGGDELEQEFSLHSALHSHPSKVQHIPGPTGRSGLSSASHHGPHPMRSAAAAAAVSGGTAPSAYNFNYPFNFNTSHMR